MEIPNTSLSPHGDVVLDKLHVLEPASKSESSKYRVPRSLSMSIACCACPVYPSHSEGKFAEISAFVPAADSECVHLHCEGVPMQQFTFRYDSILGIKLLSLPGKKETVEYTQVAGVLLIVASLKKGLSIFSTVLDKQEGSTSFKPVECREFRARTSMNDNIWYGRRIRSMTAIVVNANEQFTRPFLLIAASSSSKGPGQTSADQRVDVQKYTLLDHNCPIFHFTTESLADMSPSHQVVAVEAAGRVIGMTLGTISASGFISLAVMTSTQLTVVQVSLTPLSLLQSVRLLLSGCHPTHRLGAASMVVCLGAEDGDADIESFAVVCKPKSSDFAYQHPVQTRKMIGSHVNAFTQEESVITKSANSLVSPNLTDRIISGSGLDMLIEDTVSAAMKEFRKSRLDEAVRTDEEASKVVANDKKIVDITDERIGDKTKVADASVSLLSPLMGITLAAGEPSGDESTLIHSLLSIQTRHPIPDRLSPSCNMYPDHTFHWIIARVEHSGGKGECKIKVTSAAMPFPYQMARLEIVSLRPLVYCPDESLTRLTRQSARAAVLFGDLSQSQGKISSPAPGKVASDGPRFSIVCKTADSQELYIFIVSVRESTKMCVESQAKIDLDRLLFASLAVPITSLSVKGIAIDETSTVIKAGRLECFSNIRWVLSLVAKVSEDSSGLAPVSKPINLSLEEDGVVFILALLCTVPLYSDQVHLPLELPDPSTPRGSGEQTGAVEPSFRLILEKLTSFEKEVYSRMDAMEKTIKENSDRVGALEAALVKDLVNDIQS